MIQPYLLHVTVTVFMAPCKIGYIFVTAWIYLIQLTRGHWYFGKSVFGILYFGGLFCLLIIKKDLTHGLLDATLLHIEDAIGSRPTEGSAPALWLNPLSRQRWIVTDGPLHPAEVLGYPHTHTQRSARQEQYLRRQSAVIVWRWTLVCHFFLSCSNYVIRESINYIYSNITF